MARQQTAQGDAPYRGISHVFLFGVVAILIAAVIVVAFNQSIRPILIWLVLLALLTALLLVISHAYTHRWLGLLIDERNKYSLSRLQMALWTMIVLSAFITAVLANLQLVQLVTVTGAVNPPQVVFAPVGTLVVDVLAQVGVYDPDDSTISPDVDVSQLDLASTVHDGEVIYVPLKDEVSPQAVAQSDEESTGQITTPISVQIPSEVWLLLGISTTSLVASPLIKNRTPDQIVKNQSATEAKLSDLFRGEQTGDITQLDLGKVQMFFFTVIVVGAYAIALASMFITRELSAITSLPALDSGVIAMLGVSHAGYLTNKAVPKEGGGAGAPPEAEAASTTPLLPGDDQGAG
jgi:uncharacterized membrane protein YvlD (DUF360 family)